MKIKEKTQVSGLLLPTWAPQSDKPRLFQTGVSCFASIWQILHLDGTWHSRHHRENTDEIKRLKDQLKGEMEEHIGG